MNLLADIRKKMLQQLVDETSLTDAAKRLDKPARQLSDMLAGRKSFGDKVARQMEARGGLTPYFFDGLGSGQFGGEIKHEAVGYTTVNPEKLHQVPVIGKGMGGLPDRMFTDEGRPINGHDEYAEVYSSDPAAFLVRVEGSSMWPKYGQGDYALVEPGTDPELEDDVLLRTINGEVMLKRLLSRRGGYMFGSYNDHQTYHFEGHEISWMYYVAHPVPARKIKARI